MGQLESALCGVFSAESESSSRPHDSSISGKFCCGAGCYWGTEKFIKYDYFGKKENAKGCFVRGFTGYMGPKGAPPNPTYEDVHTGETGHVEVYAVEFKGGVNQYEELVKFFFQFHDPTTPDRQGNDTGTQYASVIYCFDEVQFRIAQRIKEELQKHIHSGAIKCFASKTVTTDIRMSTIFYQAHENHQDYLQKHPRGYCNHKLYFDEWPAE
jgi:peptide-methionine (S)-S-oxide reductase